MERFSNKVCICVFLVSAAIGASAKDRIERIGLRLADRTRFFLCDGGINFWKGVTEPGRATCEVEFPSGSFQPIYKIADALVDASDVGQCIIDLGEPQESSEIAVSMLDSSNFYMSFINFRDIADSIGQVEEVADFDASDKILQRLFAYLNRRSDEIIVFQNSEMDGQSDFLYILDVTAGSFYQFFFGCG